MDAKWSQEVAVVTGGSRGIGLATAEHLARAGAQVMITSRREQGLQEAAAALESIAPGRCSWAVCNVGVLDEIAPMLDLAASRHGVVTQLVNNAGTNLCFGPAITTDMGALEKTFAVNVYGPFHAARLMARACMDQGVPGSIVNVSSIYGLGAAPLQTAYGMTKAAIVSMTRSLAAEWGSSGVRVNAVAPGLVRTRLAAALIDDPVANASFTGRAPLGRVGTPDEIAGLIRWLLSDEARFVTGQTIAADAGYSVT